MSDLRDGGAVRSPVARIACVLVPHLPVQALRRADPELAEAPLAVVRDGKLLVDCSREAALMGVSPGLSVSQARAIAPDVVLRPEQPPLERAAGDALADLGAAFSPRVEPHADHVLLDVADLGRLFENESQIATALHAGARKLGLDARVGLARDPVTARVAALAHEGVTVVPPGREAPFLARLPLSLAEPAPEVVATLRAWGVRTIGELANLPEGGVALRLGREGTRLSLLARGELEVPLVPRPDPLLFEESFDLEWPVEDAEALLFVLKRLCESLLARLTCRGLAASDLELALVLDPSFLDASARAGAGRELRRVAVAAPTRESNTLLALLRVALEQAPPPAPVTSLSLRMVPAAVRAAQLGLFEPPGPSPDKLATLLARLQALVGNGRVGAPSLLDSHLPDSFTVGPFAPSARPPSLPGAASAPRAIAAPDAVAPAPGGEDCLRPLSLHAFRPPRVAEAHFDRGRLRYLAAEGVAGQVLGLAGPFRVRDGWWQSSIARDYFDVELSDGAVYRVFQDRLAGAWYVEGCYE